MHLSKICVDEDAADDPEAVDQARNYPNLLPWRKGNVPKIILFEEGCPKDAIASTGRKEGEPSPSTQGPGITAKMIYQCSPPGYGKSMDA